MSNLFTFEAPDDWDLRNCHISIVEDVKNEEISVVPMSEHPYYGEIDRRIISCVERLREHFSLGVIDGWNTGSIEQLERTTDELMRY